MGLLADYRPCVNLRIENTSLTAIAFAYIKGFTMALIGLLIIFCAARCKSWSDRNDGPSSLIEISCSLHAQSSLSIHLKLRRDFFNFEAGIFWPAVQLGPHQLP